MNKQVIPIKGMHCRSCELLVSDKIKEIPEVKNVQVNYKKKQAIVYSRRPIALRIFEEAIIEAGYGVGIDDSKSLISKDTRIYRDLGISFAVLLLVYFVAKELGFNRISVGGSSNPSSLLVVLIVGLTAGISTCMALVGGLVLGISARFSEKHPEANSIQKFRPHVFFNIGRIISYFIFGGIIGLIGSAFQLTGVALGLLTIAVGLVMFILGLQLTEVFPRLNNGGLTLPSSISRLLGIKKHHEKEYSHLNSVFVGALTFFLPCGFTQAMQLYAMTTGSFTKGALIMGIFALGTAPGLLSVGGLTAVVKGAFARYFFKFAGLLVVFLAIFNISNGYNLTGWKISLGSTEKGSSSDIALEDGKQIVKMTQNAYGYSPNSFTVKQNVPVKWIINSTDSQTCAASIISSKFGIRKSLKPGENILEFTPKEIGDFKFSCSMGMYRGIFRVLENKVTKVGTVEAQSEFDKQTAQSVPNPERDVSQEKPKAASPVVPTPNKEDPTPAPAPTPEAKKDTQVIKTTYTDLDTDISPSSFVVDVGTPVRFEIAVKVDGSGCMSTIMIPGLVNEPELLESGKTIVFEFTPAKKGIYDITCAMGVPRGSLIVS